MLEIVEKLENRLVEIDSQMADPEVLSDQKKLIELNRERRHVEDMLSVGREYREAQVGKFP